MQENNNQSSNDPSALFPDETQKKSLSVYDDSKSGVNPVNNIIIFLKFFFMNFYI